MRLCSVVLAAVGLLTVACSAGPQSLATSGAATSVVSTSAALTTATSVATTVPPTTAPRDPFRRLAAPPAYDRNDAAFVAGGDQLYLWTAGRVLSFDVAAHRWDDNGQRLSIMPL